MFLGILQNTRRGIGERTKLLWLLVATKGKLGVEVTALDSSSLLGNEDWGKYSRHFLTADVAVRSGGLRLTGNKTVMFFSCPPRPRQ
jgi:hypothetical protein